MPLWIFVWKLTSMNCFYFDFFLHCLLFYLSSTEHLSPTESDGDMLGYDLYSSALADILSEPTMQPPICVGLYAQWGSGKSFLLKKLEGTCSNIIRWIKCADKWFLYCGFLLFLTLVLNSSLPSYVSSSSDEMKTFAGQQIEPLFQFSWLVVFLTLLLCGSVAVVLGFTVNPKLAIAVSLSLLALLYIFFGEEIKFTCQRSLKVAFWVAW